ncbi:xanthine dehydrogenase family protein molybdopterin-binding subunit [Litorisediminicola beolgyonensis]|uniref:Molybdopterin cofactor-binding domain-containing protein n=1 Tax=Litorisediminicola beolgyonensis TaxID=1173614 RepID=A0ABW3ZGQ8_9RHOB
MAGIGKIVRRSFLVGAAALGGGLALGVWALQREARNPFEGRDDLAALGPFILIDAEGVTLVTPRAEMGQGTQTTLAALLAEELDLDWDQVRVIHGPPAPAYANEALIADALPGLDWRRPDWVHAVGAQLGKAGKYINMQVTGGSTSMIGGYEKMRVAGAMARDLLVRAAEARTGAAPGTLSTEAGSVIGPDGARLSYAELAQEAAELEPRAVALKPRSDWRLLGHAQPRLDVPDKVQGRTVYGMDLRLDGMRFATVRMNPRQGGGMRGFDDSAALAMTGVEKVVDLGTGIAVIARNSWLAMRAAEAVEIEWEDAPYPATTQGLFDAIAEAFETEPNATLRDDGDAEGDLVGTAVEIEAEYRAPFLAHATMEPMNATARFGDDQLEVWVGTQAPLFARALCADAAGLETEAVTVNVLPMGGGFGRRAEVDAAVLATRVAMALPGVPVQTVWSREEDIRHDAFRPGAVARMRGAVQDGAPVLLDARMATISCTRQIVTRLTGLSAAGPDAVSVEGLYDQPYAIPSYRARGYLADLPIPVGFWRSVGNSHNAFFLESFVDELAHAAGADPLAFRLEMLRSSHPPSAAVLEAVAEMSGWGDANPEGTAKGVAFCRSFGTPVAQVVEVTRRGEAIAVTRAWIACDPGISLDPGIITAQMEGGCLMGLSAGIGEEVTFEDGIAQEANYDRYRLMRLPQAPELEVRILENGDAPSGIGEPGLPPAAPALANAIFSLTQTRIRSLPLNRSVAFAENSKG